MKMMVAGTCMHRNLGKRRNRLDRLLSRASNGFFFLDHFLLLFLVPFLFWLCPPTGKALMRKSMTGTTSIRNRCRLIHRVYQHSTTSAADVHVLTPLVDIITRTVSGFLASQGGTTDTECKIMGGPHHLPLSLPGKWFLRLTVFAAQQTHTEFSESRMEHLFRL